ncbi:hypothetical protein GH714_005737 [Hevea brasiliensis]|uniref:TFIIS N-terminal domain-containing protein n=1 Tax=Hevea brasiliensis TaxID=3981 RepID=A0A6A6MWR3_HEVBR|nr:hypothetical protein GH714_005737 [Hevea brasiliensis]
MLCALSSPGRCRSMGRISDGHEMRENRNEAKGGDGCRSGSIYGDEHEENDDELDPFAGLFDDKQKKILEIIQHLENPDQSQDSLVDLLQTLADMDMTFEALKDTGIERHVSSLRKHSSDDVRRLVKQLVRKWREIVDEWLRLNPQEEQASSTLTADGNSPQQKISRNQVPDIAYSPNTHKESSDSDKKTCEPEGKPKPLLGMGIKFDDEVLGLWLLNTLPNSWEMFRVSLTNSAPNGVVSFEMAKGSVLNEEMRRRSQVSLEFNETTWLVDSGTSHHVTLKKEFFNSYASCDFGILRMGNGGLSQVIGIEGVCLDTSNGMKVMLKDVKNAPNVHLKFISAGRLDDKGYLNIMGESKWKLTKGSLVIA